LITNLKRLLTVKKTAYIYLFLLELINFTVDTVTVFEHLFHIHQVVNASNEHVNELDFRESESVSVGDIKKSAFGSAIDSTSTSLL